MRWDTHALLGINALWLLTPVVHQPDPVLWMLLVGCAAFGALLPDLDASNAKIKHLSVATIKPFTLPAVAFHQALGHRGMLHSLMGLGLISFVAISLAFTFWWPWQIVAALILGYASHLIADACTKSGIPLRYPDTTHCYLLAPQWRIATASLTEEILVALLSAPAIALFLTQFGRSPW